MGIQVSPKTIPKVFCQDIDFDSSGGPLTVQEVSYVLAGVVSGGGRVCGQPRVPSIYTRVAQYAEWLKVGEMTVLIF